MSTDNDRRVERAAQALSRYLPVTRVPDIDEMEDAITDLLTDLRHYTAAYDLDFGRMANSSGRHFRAEQENP